jgi:ethanolamine ammonia-lyase large subunit
MAYTQIGGNCTYRFDDLKMLMAKASPARSGDSLAGIAAATEKERMAAQMALAEVPLTRFLEEALVPYEEDEVTRLIFDSHDRDAFIPISHMTVGDFRDWLLSSSVDGDALTSVAAGITPEMAAAVSKLMRNQDLILVAQKCRIITRFRNSISSGSSFEWGSSHVARLQLRSHLRPGCGRAVGILAFKPVCI